MSNTSTSKLYRTRILGLVGVRRSSPAGAPQSGHPLRSPFRTGVPPRSGQQPRRHRGMPRVRAHGSAVSRGKEVGNADQAVPCAASPRVTATPFMASSLATPPVPGGAVLPGLPISEWGAGAAARGQSLAPGFAPSCSETKRQRAGGRAAPSPGQNRGLAGAVSAVGSLDPRPSRLDSPTPDRGA